MHRLRTFTSGLLFAGLALAAASSAAPPASNVPIALLDSIEANLWRTDTSEALSSLRVHSTTKMLDGDGGVKHEEEMWQYVEVKENGDKVFYKTDALGNRLPDEEPTVEKADDDEDTTAVEEKDGEVSVGVKVGPLDPVRAENRDQHRLTLLPSPGDGQVAIKTEPLDEETGGFEGTIVVDTTTWLPVSVTGTPLPMPDKKIKAMQLTIQYKPWGEDYAFPHLVTSDVTAKWLLFSFHIRSTQEFYDFVPKGDE